MTKIKFCGLTRPCDIEAVNELKPDYIGFVFWERSKRYITRWEAKELKAMLSKDIKAVGVFVDEDISQVAELLKDGIIDIAQLHGSEDEAYIKELRKLTDKQIITTQIKSTAFHSFDAFFFFHHTDHIPSEYAT